MDKDYETVLWVSDHHVPYHDVKAIKGTIDLAKDIQPDKIIFGGDVVDFYQVSSFDKDVNRAFKLQQDVDKGHEMLLQYRCACPDTEMIYLEGNHEVRMKRYLKKNPELSGIRALTVPALLELDELDIEYRDNLFYKGFLFKHGDYTNKYHANKELEVEGISGMAGHNHRNQMMARSDRRGDRAWYSVGHLSDVAKQDYMSNKAVNWQQGIAIIHFKKRSKRFHVTSIPLSSSKFIYNGKEYGG